MNTYEINTAILIMFIFKRKILTKGKKVNSVYDYKKQQEQEKSGKLNNLKTFQEKLQEYY